MAHTDPKLRSEIERILSQRWSTECVADGIAALLAARTRRPDLVLAEAMMIGLDGFELLHALRAEERTAGVPVLLLSARNDEGEDEDLPAGADDYLVTPFRARELIARVRTHLELSRIKANLELERSRLYSLLMQAPAIISITRGPDHVYELSNPLHRRTMGGKDVVGKTVREALPELEAAGMVAVLDSVYSTGEPAMLRGFPAKSERKDGSPVERYFDWIAAPLRDARGEVEGILGFAYDVTERVLAQRDAEEANRAKDEFLAMLGHELRNPLSPIVTALHLMRLRSAPEGIFERERAIIERQVTHLVRLVDDLLDVSRVTRGKIELARQRLEIGVIVAKAFEIVGPLIEARNHRLEVDVPAEGLCVFADEHRLAQVISNLLTNAAKYTEPGGHVEVRAWRDADDVVIAIRDNGMGIAPHLLARVFELFVQGERTLDRAQGGLGLGLAIVRNLVALHGGSVTAKSDGPGKGSEFVVRLARAPDDTKQEAPSKAPSNRPRHVSHVSDVSHVSSRARRVLIVDDNHDVVDLLAGYLKNAGYAVRCAYDGAAAVEEAMRSLPEIALLDLGLPVMDGFELARRLRALPSGEMVRLVAITGYGLEAHRERTRAAGFDEHLVKPIALDALDAMLEQLLAVD